MIESLINIRDEKKRDLDLSPDHVEHLCYIHTLIFNGATWDKVVQRREITYSELGVLLMPLNADEIRELQAQGEQNWSDFIVQTEEDIRLTKWHKAHPRISRWPEPDPNCFDLNGRPLFDTETIAIQVNGKLRGTVVVPTGTSQLLVEDAAFQDTRITAHIEGKQITRKVFVPGRVLNFVVQDGMG